MIKKISLVLFLATIVGNTFGKAVKFSVDMTGQIINVTGVHITGDFQGEAGFPGGDWQPNTTAMAQEGSSNIYSTVVNIPAFQKYEFKFVNGIETYELEFVPVESRVDEAINDNRWIYIDSLSNDTMNIPAIVFAANAPTGYYLLRLKVDMQNENVPAEGVHVSGSFQSFNDATTRMYSFDGNVYQYIAYKNMLTGILMWEYVNGNTIAQEETVPTACVNGISKRYDSQTADVVLPVVCFSSCNACIVAGVAKGKINNAITVYPNPASNQIIIKGDIIQSKLEVFDAYGKMILHENMNGNSFTLNVSNLSRGIYFLKSVKPSGEINISSFVKE